MGESSRARSSADGMSILSPFTSSKDQAGVFVSLSNATRCRQSNEVTSCSCLINIAEAVLQSLHVAIAFAACSNAKYRSSSTLGNIDAAVTINLCPSQID